MNIKKTFLALLLNLMLCGLVSSGEPVHWDDLMKAVNESGRSLTTGKNRQQIFDILGQEIQKHPTSSYLEYATQLHGDLALSLKKEQIIREEQRREGGVLKEGLMESTLHLELIIYRSNGRPLQEFRSQHPRDPMIMVLDADRSVIDTLVPMLSDSSPTRSYPYGPDYFDVPSIPRVCDLTIHAIEFHSLCRFHFNSSSGTLFHELPPEKQTEMIRHIEQWWSENKGKSLATGIRSQFPHGDFYAQVWMAENLAKMEGEEAKPDREYGLELLRGLVRTHWGHLQAHAARSLAQFNDFSSLEVISTQWSKSLEKPGSQIYDSAVVFYLTEYGARRGWELLYKIAQMELKHGVGGLGTGSVWAQLVYCDKSSSSLWAIPGLALALSKADPLQGHTKEETSGTRVFSRGDVAVEYLQQLTQIDFGYRRGSSSNQEVSAAIQKAQKWWKDQGSQTYTFDHIEEMMAKKPK